MRAISGRGFMSKTSLTASDHSNNRGNNVVASDSNPLSSDDFVMMCPFGDGGLDEAILALYYLPPQFKLRVLMDATGKLPFAGHESLKGRISLETGTGTPIEASPFSNANAVVYSEATPVQSASATPRVVISKSAQTLTQSTDGHTFTITEHSPEALASAILSIAKATA
jgi:hypothetical protein